MGTLGVLLDPFIPRKVLDSCHSLLLIGWFRCDCLDGSALGHTRMTNTFPQVSANQLKIGIFEISEQINELNVKKCSLHDFAIKTTTTQSNLTSTDLVKGHGGQFREAFQNLANHICWKIIISESFCNCLETKRSNMDIFTWESGDIKSLEIGLKSIKRFLGLDHHAFHDAVQSGDGSLLVMRDVEDVRLDFSTKCFLHGQLQCIFQSAVALQFSRSAMAKDEFLPIEVISIIKGMNANL
jgi:hypothetical protein